MTDGAPDDDVQLTARQARRAAREAKRQAKDAAYEERLARKRSKDVQFWHGHHVIDAAGLAEAFPEPETAEYSARTVRRRITHGVTLVLLLALVVAGVVVAGMIQRGELVLHFGTPRPVATADSCPAGPFDYPANKTVTVNVYNGGSEEGLAGQVAAELKKRGYKVKAVANGSTPYDAPVVVVSGAAGRAAAFNLQRNVKGAEYVQDSRKDATVDFIVTSSYDGLIDARKVDQTPGPLSCPRLGPTPAAPTAKPATPAAKG
ncbi:LytR C-terminal domain-containing protein [Arthrobacter sp. STN4]|uniref:LytR C-terminal domain-containing protein n=1 Tax=Arthrobacter sp. STN4 TaxID=2923276 RepID=UPI00211A949A|nr:LytR C-terminal domain-containing protein [Arthrobacter sp. STN4]MCQ9162707.1 LytR C-terminal domain-containing protein [Arthrobacter sp. STN4]